MSNRQGTSGGDQGPDSLDARLANTLGRIGDQASAPDWDTIMNRRAQMSNSRWQWKPVGPGRRPLMIALAGLVLVIAGSAAMTQGLFDSDIRFDTTGTADQVTDPVPDDRTTTPSDGSGGSWSGPAAGCYDTAPAGLSGLDLTGAGPADVDGDGSIDTISATAFDPDAPTDPVLIVVELGDGRWGISESEDGRRPRFDADWPPGRNLDGIGGDEVLAYEDLNSGTTVTVYRYQPADCSLSLVRQGGGPTADPVDFAVRAHSESCQDWCNAALVCEADGQLVSIMSDPVDRADGRGDHRWTTTSWRFVDGELSITGEDSGLLPFDELDRLGPVNDVACGPADTPDISEVGSSQGEEVRALADLVGAQTLVGQVSYLGRPDQAMYVYDSGAVTRPEMSGTVPSGFGGGPYTPGGMLGDAMGTVSPGSRQLDGPFLDLDGTIIDCPVNPMFAAVPTAYEEAMGLIMRAEPVRTGAGWGYLERGEFAGDRSGLIELDGTNDRFRAVPLNLVDCGTGERQTVPSRGGVLDQDGTPVADSEIFLTIEHVGDATWYFSGGEGFITVHRGDGTVLVPETEMYSWAVSDDGTIIGTVDFGGTARGYDAVTGDLLWSSELGFGGHRATVLGDRLIFSDDALHQVVVVSIATGEVLAPTTSFDAVSMLWAS